MIILSMDSAAKTASVCLSEYKQGELYPLCEVNLNSTLTHSESLLPMIDFCLEGAKKKISDVDISVISAGPGSFTGVRIGISALMGLELARDLSETYKVHATLGVSTLLALALNVKEAKVGDIVCPVMDARRSQFYNALFRKTKDGLKRLCDDRIVSASSLESELCEKYPNKNIIVNGDGAQLYLSLSKNQKVKKCHNSCLYENAFSVALAASYTDTYENILQNCHKYSCNNLSPLYLRQSQAERELNEKNKGKV